MVYRRMDLDVAALICEVEARPSLWDKSNTGYTDRHRRNTAWTQICKALYPDWSRLTQSQQGVIERDIKNRWKTVRDRFFKFLRTSERDGSSLYPYPKCPFFEELLFLLPNRSLRPSGGNFHSKESRETPPVAQEQHPQFKRESSPVPISEDIEERIVEDEQAGSSRGATPSLDDVDEAPSIASIKVNSPLEHPIPLTRTPPPRPWGRKSLRAMDRQLEVESEAMSLMRKVDGEDDCDFFGYGIATRCRQMHPRVRNDFMSYVYAAAAVFDSANPMPELGDLINHLRSVTGLRGTPFTPKPEVMSTSSQTDPVNFTVPPSNPTAGSQF
ncbi:uncharacterized protein RB166_009343 [Leptodactylus fuscus]|uniref:uncharacterized protein LOC142204008 n=1 Tax=Leptodactylus fuscus TaxID=238119 RepID=UPI003F4E508E